ncbi:MAG TPA: hypothetical protein VN934_03905 [Candidatus Tumulicola sp.]|jgi:hypothetical protein|nr:hypothetical protein [Candidatus Tumulicola sp.]
MKRKKKKSPKRAIATAKKKLAIQRRRAARPTLPVNAHAQVSESLVERKRRLEKRRVQKRDWENL